MLRANSNWTPENSISFALSGTDDSHYHISDQKHISDQNMQSKKQPGPGSYANFPITIQFEELRQYMKKIIIFEIFFG